MDGRKTSSIRRFMNVCSARVNPVSSRSQWHWAASCSLRLVRAIDEANGHVVVTNRERHSRPTIAKDFFCQPFFLLQSLICYLVCSFRCVTSLFAFRTAAVQCPTHSGNQVTPLGFQFCYDRHSVTNLCVYGHYRQFLNDLLLRWRDRHKWSHHHVASWAECAPRN